MHMHAKYQVSICNGSKVMANVKVVLKQTNNVTNRQGKNNMPPRSCLGGIKRSNKKVIAKKLLTNLFEMSSTSKIDKKRSQCFFEILF